MVERTASRWQRFLESPAAPGLLFATFIGLILFTIGRFGMWIDESATIALVGHHGVGQLLHRVKLDAHPPLGYLVLKPWLSLFGANILASRSESAVFMVAAFGVWFHFFKTRFSRPVALLTLTLMVGNPLLVHYAVEGRMYAFGMLLTAITCVLATSTWKWRWFAYWPVAVAMLYTHYFLAFAIGAQFLYMLIARRELGLKIPWILLFGASILLTFVPWLPNALHMTNQVVTNGFWIPVTSAYTVTSYLLATFLHRLDSDVEAIRVFPALAYLAAWGAALIRAGRVRKGPHQLLWCLAGIPPLMLLILSCKPLVPIFHPRYVIYGLPALIALLAIGALDFAGLWRKLVIAILVIGAVAGIEFMEWRGFNEVKGFWAIESIKKDVTAKIDGETPTVITNWVFPFFDLKIALPPEQPVMHFRKDAPNKESFPDVLYYDKPDWYILNLDTVHAKYVWYIDELMKAASDVPDNWNLITLHRRGYVRERLYEIGPKKPKEEPKPDERDEPESPANKTTQTTLQAPQMLRP